MMLHPALPDPPGRGDIAAEGLRALTEALRCIDALGAHECGAHLDHVVHRFRAWCAAQPDMTPPRGYKPD